MFRNFLESFGVLSPRTPPTQHTYAMILNKKDEMAVIKTVWFNQYVPTHKDKVEWLHIRGKQPATLSQMCAEWNVNRETLELESVYRVENDYILMARYTGDGHWRDFGFDEHAYPEYDYPSCNRRVHWCTLDSRTGVLEGGLGNVDGTPRHVLNERFNVHARILELITAPGHTREYLNVPDFF
jgi:hypothetical protein